MKRVVEGVIAGLIVAAATPFLTAIFMPNLLASIQRGWTLNAGDGGPPSLKVGIWLAVWGVVSLLCIVVMGAALNLWADKKKAEGDGGRTERVLSFWMIVFLAISAITYFAVLGWLP